jgi:hypothetical protein
MYFKIDDSYAYGGPVEATITVTYFDRGSDSWELVYDAAGNATKSAGTVTKTGTNRWKTRQFTVPDAMFANNQLGGADFHIDAGGSGDEYLHMVDVRVGEAAGETHDINLITSNGGWNFVSTRLVPRSTSIEDVLSNIEGKYDLVQAYVDGTWRSYQPGVGGDLSSLDETGGFWIRVTQNCTLSVLGDAPASTTIHLSSAGDGWNMISWPSNDTRNVETALASIAGSYDRVYSYNALDSEDQWKVYDPVAPDYANDLAQLSPGHAYWVRVVTDCDLNVSY